MIIVMKEGASKAQSAEIISRVEALGYRAHPIFGVERTVIGCVGDERGKSELETLISLKSVERVVPILSPYKLAAKQLQSEPTTISLSDSCSIGRGSFTVIAGPCSVESEEQIVSTAQAVKAAGAHALRGGAFKPRSSTYTFQGLGKEGLKLLRLAKVETGLPIVTEILDHYMLDLCVEYADVLQVGARNMYNTALLKALGGAGKPVLLKRAMSATVEELLNSAEYVLSAGNPDVILCERGIRTFETATRNTLDLNAVPALQERTHLPIIVDPSHGTGVASYVAPMSKAALACGADGLMVEVHPDPAKAFSDGVQSLTFEVFTELMKELTEVAAALNRTVNAKCQPTKTG